MIKAFRIGFISFFGLALALPGFFPAAVAALPGAPAAAAIKWRDCLKQKPEWYGSKEALRIAENVLLYQQQAGGWAKNIDMATVLDDRKKADLLKAQSPDESTIDNGATWTQLTFLALVHNHNPIERYRRSFLQGLDYLLKAQYENGGWPQYYPLRKGYYTHITYNDNAMIGVLTLLRDVAHKQARYAFVDDDRRRKAANAVERGIECILKTQIIVSGKRTVWCAQHDEKTLAPAPARAYELISLSGYESAGIVRFLMSLDRPDARVIEAVESAIAWFEKTRLSGIRWIEKPDATKPRGYDRVVIADADGRPLWARFYEIETNRPIFVGRDGIVRYNVAEIEEERRNGYRWYVTEPAALVEKDYPAWRSKWRN